MTLRIVINQIIRRMKNNEVKHKRKEDWDFRGMKDVDYHNGEDAGRWRKMGEEKGGREQEDGGR